MVKKVKTVTYSLSLSTRKARLPLLRFASRVVRFRLTANRPIKIF